MIRVLIEILPQGDPSRKRTVGVVEIVSREPSTPERADYSYTIAETTRDFFGERGIVRDFDRSKHALELVGAVLDDCFHQKNEGVSQ